MSPVNNKMELVACYIRVSTQEQKLHGISLDAQRHKLKEYAKKHNLKIVAWYEDEGISGRKLIKKRPALQSMIKDAQAKKFNRILFIKLDRFFRSVAEYHECMKLIDPVIWTATEEKYDLSTANGRAFVNMKITIAELEADQTGERIKIVNDYKVKSGQALQGSQSLGLAFTVKKDKNGVKRVVPDPDNKDMVNDIINHIIKYQSKSATCKYIYKKYNYSLSIQALTRLLKNSKLYGTYRNNPNYCDPYIDKATFDLIQEKLTYNIKRTSRGISYLFTGLVKCPCCGKNLVNTVNNYGLVSLRCNGYVLYRKCNFKSLFGEKKLEADLIDNFNNHIDKYVNRVNVSDNRAESDNELTNKRIKEIKTEMSNSVKSFNKGRMSEADHDKEYATLEAELKELEAQLEPLSERDLTVYEDLLKSDWLTMYKSLNRERQRAFWRKYVKEIVIDNNRNITEVIFF